jgi:hypothetical protein
MQQKFDAKSFVHTIIDYLAKSIVNPNDRSIGLKKLP